MVSENLLPWIALTLLPGLGPVLQRRLLEQFGDAEAIAFRLSSAALASVHGIGRTTAETLIAAREVVRRAAADELRKCARLKIEIWTMRDPCWPAALETLSDPPILLYAKGTLPEATVRMAVVGSRRATPYGQRVAAGLGAGLAQRGIEVVSGGARGIDTAAHVGALEAGGRTVAVLGSGLGRPYPTENGALFERIAASGTLLSEFPLDTSPLPENFPRRNRLISGLSAAVIVVEATAKSGSLLTAAHALDQGRDVLAVPGPVSSPQSEGCHRLIQQGARLVQGVEDVLAELGPMYAGAVGSVPVPGAPEVPLDLTDDEREVLCLLRDPEPVHLDALAEAAPFGVARLQAALFGLEARGAVDPLPGRYYVAAPRKET
ncbi:MAG TPA: DNA-processing protein DprA [Candidatus Polarisedimenticolaceae bacterium]|nr:DNA-processing protein DprA [Candidatus Polarisedimenticolaceae bacterium]